MTTADAIPALSLQWRLKMALEDAQIGVAEMGERMGVSRETISNWINGRVVPRAAFLRVWADECGVDPEWLTHGRVRLTPRELADLLELTGADGELEFDVVLAELLDGKGVASISMTVPRGRPRPAAAAVSTASVVTLEQRRTAWSPRVVAPPSMAHTSGATFVRAA